MEQELLRLFAISSISSGFLMTITSNPIYAICYLVAVFINASALYIILGIEYLAIIFIIVYVGAVSILFIFVIMMLNIGTVTIPSSSSNIWIKAEQREWPINIFLYRINKWIDAVNLIKKSIKKTRQEGVYMDGRQENLIKKYNSMKLLKYQRLSTFKIRKRLERKRKKLNPKSKRFNTECLKGFIQLKLDLMLERDRSLDLIKNLNLAPKASNVNTLKLILNVEKERFNDSMSVILTIIIKNSNAYRTKIKMNNTNTIKVYINTKFKDFNSQLHKKTLKSLYKNLAILVKTPYNYLNLPNKSSTTTKKNLKEKLETSTHTKWKIRFVPLVTVILTIWAQWPLKYSITNTAKANENTSQIDIKKTIPLSIAKKIARFIIVRNKPSYSLHINNSKTQVFIYVNRFPFIIPIVNKINYIYLTHSLYFNNKLIPYLSSSFISKVSLQLIRVKQIEQQKHINQSLKTLRLNPYLQKMIKVIFNTSFSSLGFQFQSIWIPNKLNVHPQPHSYFNKKTISTEHIISQFQRKWTNLAIDNLLSFLSSCKPFLYREPIMTAKLSTLLSYVPLLFSTSNPDTNKETDSNTTKSGYFNNFFYSPKIHCSASESDIGVNTSNQRYSLLIGIPYLDWTTTAFSFPIIHFSNPLFYYSAPSLLYTAVIPGQKSTNSLKLNIKTFDNLYQNNTSNFFYSYSTYTAFGATSNLIGLGKCLYTVYWSSIFLASFILLVAMIGAILLSLDHHPSLVRQNLFSQINTLNTVLLFDSK